jgi:DNA/RNA endonuclease YhcR with UshA esterase domain
MEKRLAVFIIMSLIGILLLVFLSQKLEPKTMSISGISEKNLEQSVKIRGQIVNAREYNNKTFQVLTVKDQTGNITAIMNLNTEITINKSKNYSIIGKVQAYNQTLQISIDRITAE